MHFISKFKSELPLAWQGLVAFGYGILLMMVGNVRMMDGQDHQIPLHLTVAVHQRQWTLLQNRGYFSAAFRLLFVVDRVLYKPPL
jgi:hypothetical protein